MSNATMSSRGLVIVLTLAVTTTGCGNGVSEQPQPTDPPMPTQPKIGFVPNTSFGPPAFVISEHPGYEAVERAATFLGRPTLPNMPGYTLALQIGIKNQAVTSYYGPQVEDGMNLNDYLLAGGLVLSEEASDASGDGVSWLKPLLGDRVAFVTLDDVTAAVVISDPIAEGVFPSSVMWLSSGVLHEVRAVMEPADLLQLMRETVAKDN